MGKIPACNVTKEEKRKLWDKYEYYFVGLVNTPIPVRINILPSHPNVIFKEGLIGQTASTPETHPNDYNWMSYQDFEYMLIMKLAEKRGVKF